VSANETKRWVDLAGDEGSKSGDADVARAARLLANVPDPAPRRGARQRVYRRLQRQSAPRERRMLAVAISGAVVGALIVFFALVPRSEVIVTPSTSETQVAEVLSVEGRAEVRAATGERRALERGQALASGARLTTDRTGKSELAVLDSSRVLLQPLTEIAVAELDRSVDVDLARGELFVSVERSQVKRLSIIAGRWRVTTEMGSARIRRNGADDLDVEVLEGAAQIDGPSTHERLGEGHHFSTEARASNEAALDDQPLVKNAPASLRIHRTLSARPHVDAHSPVRTPPTAAAMAPPSDPTEAAERAPAPPPEGPSDTPAIPVAPTRAVEASRAAVPESTATLYARAKAEEDPARAIRLFDEVVARGDSYAEIASYQAARTAMHAGRCRDAIDRFRDHLARYARGQYALESRLDVIECRIKLGELEAAGGDLEAFLTAYPKSERSPDVLFLRAELHRQKGELKPAMTDYRASTGARHEADALFFEAWCAMQLGEKSAARAAFERYISRYPRGSHVTEAERALEAFEKLR
jgi:TolA-binding protein/ferric-dicitrate binding protein FerR (iron transport regulator)